MRIAVLLPDLLGTYGDRGNAIVLASRLIQRGIHAEIVDVHSGTAIPASCDIYLIGGGEDAAQAEAVRLLKHSSFAQAVTAGATVFGVCAGLQILGVVTEDEHGRSHDGLGLLDARTRSGKSRSIGEIVTRVDQTVGLSDPVLTGFENHRGLTEIGPSAQPLAQIQAGVGNGDGTEGAISGRVVATYLHGPILARNPAFADYLLKMATGLAQEPLRIADIAGLRRSGFDAAHRNRGMRHEWTKKLTSRRWSTPGVPRT